MVLAAPEFVEAERVDLLDEIEVAAELQQRMLADRVMRGEKGSELQACHGVFSPDLVVFGSARRQGTGRAGARQSSYPAASAWWSREVRRLAVARNSAPGRNGCHRPTSSQGWAEKISYLPGNRGDDQSLRSSDPSDSGQGPCPCIRSSQPPSILRAAGGCSPPSSRRNSCSGSTLSSSTSRSRPLLLSCTRARRRSRL